MGRTPLKKNEHTEKVYCRKCQKYKPESSFYSATDTFLDSNGLMSICKDCSNQIYDDFFTSEKNMEKVILEMCRMLNIRFDLGAIEATKAQIETYAEKGTKVQAIFGTYKSKLTAAMPKGKIGDKEHIDLTFYEPLQEVIKDVNTQENGKNLEYYQEIWGLNYDMEDYLFLENDLAEWKRTTKCDTHPEEVLLKEICHLENTIRKKRIRKDSVSSELDDWQKMLKLGGYTPAQLSAANSGKSMDAFGSWIKDIETKTPAEWYENQEKFHDMDGMEEDLEDIKRSMKNFITGSRDFNSIDLEGIVGLNVDTKNKQSSKEDVDDEKKGSESADISTD